MSSVDVVLTALTHHGLLLSQDKVVPSVVGIVTEESVAGSWWSHPKARLIFTVLAEMTDHRDVLLVKLLYRKDTLVHRSLWPALLAVATSREPWQVRGLSSSAKSLLRRVDRSTGPVRATGEPVKALRTGLLANAREIHTESGRHEMALESWRHWSTRVGVGALPTGPDGRELLDQAALKLGAKLTALPWHVGGRDARFERARSQIKRK
jgi:hypothetical protein